MRKLLRRVRRWLYPHRHRSGGRCRRCGTRVGPGEKMCYGCYAVG